METPQLPDDIANPSHHQVPDNVAHPGLLGDGQHPTADLLGDGQQPSSDLLGDGSTPDLDLLGDGASPDLDLLDDGASPGADLLDGGTRPETGTAHLLVNFSYEPDPDPHRSPEARGLAPSDPIGPAPGATGSDGTPANQGDGTVAEPPSGQGKTGSGVPGDGYVFPPLDITQPGGGGAPGQAPGGQAPGGQAPGGQAGAGMPGVPAWPDTTRGGGKESGSMAWEQQNAANKQWSPVHNHATGDVIGYSRNSDGYWELRNREGRIVASGESPIEKTIADDLATDVIANILMGGGPALLKGIGTAAGAVVDKEAIEAVADEAGAVLGTKAAGTEARSTLMGVKAAANTAADEAANSITQTTARFLGKNPVKDMTSPWAKYQIRVTGTDEESVFTLVRNGASKTINADDFVDGYLIEAKAAGFTGLMWGDGGAQAMEQAGNYIDLADTIGAKGIRYYVQDPGEMAKLITRLELDFPSAMASGKIQVFLRP